MAGFAVNAASSFTPEAPDAGTWEAAPVPFFDAVKRGERAGREVWRAGAREEAAQVDLWSRHQEVERRTGTKLKPALSMIGALRTGDADQRVPEALPEDAYEAQIDALRAGGRLNGVPTRAELDRARDTRLRATAAAEAEAGSSGAGGAAGVLVGELWAGITDPVNLAATMATGGVGATRGLATRMVMQAGANAAVETATQPVKAADARFGGPEWTPGQAAADVGFAAGGAAGLEAVGAGAKAVGGAFIRRVGGQAEPAVRRAAQVAEAGARDDAAFAGLAPDEAADAATGFDAGRVYETPGAVDVEAVGSVADYRGRPVQSVSLDPASLQTDAARFQYKAGGDAEGVTARLKGVQAWDPLAAGRILAWEARDGARFVADGHQRFGLVRRLNDVEGFEHSLDGFLFREADGWSAAEVRTVAALKNLREGSGSPLDAAKVFREAPEALGDRSLPLTGEFMDQARGLAKLSKEAFGAVVNGVVPERYAAEIGRLAAHREDLHADMVGLLRQAEPANADEARALVVEALQDDWIRTEGDQVDLFGHDPSVSAMVGRAKVAAAVKRALEKDVRLYGQLVRNADLIEAGGNALVRDVNAQRLAADKAALELTAKLSLRSGPVGEAMKAAAAKVTQGEAPGAAAREVVKRIRTAIEAGEDLAEARGVALDPPAPGPHVAQALEGFDQPGGAGARAQTVDAPEDALMDDPGLFDDLVGEGERYETARGLLALCVPAEAAE